MLTRTSQLHVAQLNSLVERLNRIVPRRRTIFVAQKSAEPQVHNSLRNEPVIQLLRIVNIVASRIPTRMEMPDPLEVVPDIAHDVAVHDLGVIDVIEDLHPRRIHPLHHVDPPGHVVEHVVLVVHFAVQQFHADCDALILGLPFDLIKKSHAVVRARAIVHPLAVTRKSNDIGHLRRRRFIDRGAHQWLDARMILRAVQRVGNAAARPRRIHRRCQPVLAQKRPVRRTDEVETLNAKARGLTAAIFQTHLAGKDTPGHPLPDAALSLYRRALHQWKLYPILRDSIGNSPLKMIRAIKGTRDLLPPDTAIWNRVERVAHEVFQVHNYHEIRTPILEETQLFARGVGQETDIVSKEMYTFEDRDGTSVTLRPENTASVIRAYIEHRLDQRPGVQKLYYIGPMFRRERPQKGRYRQFFQIGAEAIGSESPFVDAEVIEMVVEILTRAGLSGFTLLINSVGDAKCRPVFVEKLREALRPVASQLCGDCQRRVETNPLRVLDCKVPEDQPIIEKLPSILDNLCETCGPHFAAVQRYLDDRGIAYEIRPRLVRGLDYYMRTTFEVVHGNLGAQNSVLGGGRYDGLAESLGSSVPAPGIGFSIGEDRLVMTVDQTAGPALDIFMAPLGETALLHAGRLARDLRRSGVSVEVAANAKLKRAMELANKLSARYALILGDDEIAAGEYSLKDMQSGEQKRVSREGLFQIFKMMGSKN